MGGPAPHRPPDSPRGPREAFVLAGARFVSHDSVSSGAMERPTLRQLEYFAAVAKKLSFSRAAESCFVSQPSLSAQIAQLKALLGVKLFERDRRGVKVTAAG